jgi:hypothetical protein
MQSTQRKRVQFGFEQERPAKRQRVDAAVTRRAVPNSELEYEHAAVDDRRHELTGEVLPASVGVSPSSWMETTRAAEDEASTHVANEGNNTAPVAMSGLLGSIRLPRSAAPADPRFSAGKRGASQLLKRKSEDSTPGHNAAQGFEVALIVNLHPQGYSLNDQEQMHAYHRNSAVSRDLLESIDHNQLYQPLHQLVAQLQPKYVKSGDGAVKSEVKDEHGAANNSSATTAPAAPNNNTAPTTSAANNSTATSAEEGEGKGEEKKESASVKVTPVTLAHPITRLHPRHSQQSRGLPTVHYVLLRPSYEHVIGDVRQLIDRLVAESASKANNSKLNDSSAALDESVDLDSMIESFINRDETTNNSAADAGPGLRVESKSDATNLLEAKLFRALVPDLCLDPSPEVLFRNNSAHYNARKMLRSVPHQDLKRARVVPRVISTPRALGVSPVIENEHVMQVEATTEPTPLSVENGHSVNEHVDESASSTQVDTMTPVNVTLETETVTSSRKRESKLLNFLQTISYEALVDENNRYLHRESIYQPLSIITSAKAANSALPNIGNELSFAHTNKMKQAQEQSRTLKYGINKNRDYLQLDLAFTHQGSDHVHLLSEEHDPRWTGKLLVLKDVVPGKPLPARDPRYEVEFSIGDQYQTQLFVNTLNQIEMQQAGTQLIQDSAAGYQAHPNAPPVLPYMPQGQPPGSGQPVPGGPVKLPFMGPGGAVPPGMIKRPDQPMNMMPGPGGMPKLPPQMNVVPPGGLAQNPMLMQRRQVVPPGARPGAPMPQNPGQPYMPPNQQFPPNYPHHQ